MSSAHAQSASLHRPALLTTCVVLVCRHPENVMSFQQENADNNVKTKGKRASPFHWTDEHDILLCSELRNIEPYQYKPGTRESGSAWDQIANNLNSLARPKFSVSKRSVRDRYNVLRGNFVRKMSAEEKSSGIDVEESELDQLLDEICACAKEYEQRMNAESDADFARKNEEQVTAEEMRRQSMETYSERVKRKIDDEKKPKKKTRQGGNQTVTYLREKLEKETEIRIKELELRHAELDAEKRKREAVEQQQIRMAEQQTDVLRAFHVQMERQVQQQESQQQFAQMIIQSQQQQTAALMALIEKIKKKLTSKYLALFDIHVLVNINTNS